MRPSWSWAARAKYSRSWAPLRRWRTQIVAVRKIADSAGPLTARELEVLKLVASGLTNRKIGSR